MGTPVCSRRRRRVVDAVEAAERAAEADAADDDGIGLTWYRRHRAGAGDAQPSEGGAA